MALVAATGFFDGVHLGHRHVIETLCSEAARRGAESLVVTFWPHPRTVLQNGARDLRLLNSLEEKVRAIRELGADRVEVLDFTKEFAAMDTRAYLLFLKERFDVGTVLLGYDNTIGSDKLPASETASVAGEIGMEVVIDYPVGRDRLPVSSTRIRKALADGDIQTASLMLGYDYSLKGVIVSGNRLGRTLGYPTANLRLYDPLKVIPGKGVYLTEVVILGKRYFGMTNIGVRPTVSGSGETTIETHIFDFDEEVYGHDMTLSFLRRVRSEQKFPDLDTLSRQLSEDERSCRRILAEIQKK